MAYVASQSVPSNHFCPAGSDGAGGAAGGEGGAVQAAMWTYLVRFAGVTLKETTCPPLSTPSTTAPIGAFSLKSTSHSHGLGGTQEYRVVGVCQQ